MLVSEGRNWWHLLFKSKEEAQEVKELLEELIREKTPKKIENKA